MVGRFSRFKSKPSTEKFIAQNKIHSFLISHFSFPPPIYINTRAPTPSHPSHIITQPRSIRFDSIPTYNRSHPMDEETCAMSGLSLQLGLGGKAAAGCGGEDKIINNPSPIRFHMLFPPTHQQQEKQDLEEELGSFKGGGCATSGSGSRRCTRKGHEEDEEDGRDRYSSSVRKKLRLSKDQSSLLEDHFRRHTTLNLNQKTELSRRLNLLPRQVEVWFQNRRARTKLKQTEVDCGFLRNHCERLNDENRRLKVELMELRSKMNSSGVGAMTSPSQLSPYLAQTAYIQVCCPSCQKLPVLASTLPPCDQIKTVDLIATKAKSGSCESETSSDIGSSPGAKTTTTSNKDYSRSYSPSIGIGMGMGMGMALCR